MTATEILLDPTTEARDATSPPVQEQTPDADAPPATVPEAEPPAEPETALAVLGGRVEALEALSAELSGEQRVAGGHLESTRSRLDALEASQAETKHQTAVTESRLESTGSRLDATDTRLASTASRLDVTDGAVRSAGEQFTALGGRLTSVDGRLDGLDERVAALHQHAAAQDKALDEIGRTIAIEVERQTSDALVDAQHSMQLAVNSIAQLALAMAESSRDITEDVDAESATALLDSFRVDLDAILAQLGFESLETAVGAAFDPHRHRALKRVPTADALQDKIITRVIRDGYSSTATGRILLFADVEVSRHRPG